MMGMEGIDGELCDLGHCDLEPDTGALRVQAMGLFESTFDQTPVLSQLGVTAMPYPATPDGAAEGILLKGVGAYDGICVGATDSRVTKALFGEMKPGETCLHATGKKFDSRIFCKEQNVTIIISNDTLITLDRQEQKFQVVIAGCILEVSKDNGFSMAEPGGAMIQGKDGNLVLKGKVPQSGAKLATARALASMGAPSRWSGDALDAFAVANFGLVDLGCRSGVLVREAA